MSRRILPLLVWVLLRSVASAQSESALTPGYLERVVQWTVQRGERCSDVAIALYGDERHQALVQRYNDVDCRQELSEGATLVLPERPADVPVAELRAMHPDVQTRPPGGTWSLASKGMRFYDNHLVNTLDGARADILFSDRSRIFLAERTLVVIYGTASTSATSSALPSVELDEGELMAGISALHRKPAIIATSGGTVKSRSRDVVVRRRQTRSAISVFDGSAEVTGMGKSVAVNSGHGTSLVVNAEPTEPRPLPQAPILGPDSNRDVAWGIGDEAHILTTWAPVEDAVSYRIELARDLEFTNLVARVEVGAEVRAFRAERLPVGSYWVRVRAIDSQDFLGLANQREVHLLKVTPATGSAELREGRLVADRFTTLLVEAPSGLGFAVDGASSPPCPCTLDLATQPVRLTVSTQDSEPLGTLELAYRTLVTRVTSSYTADEATFSFTFSGIEASRLATHVKPRLRYGRGGVSHELKLELLGSTAAVTLPISAFSPDGFVEVRDDQDTVLISGEVTTQPNKQQVPDEPAGPNAPMFALSGWSDVAPWAFVTRPTMAVSVLASNELRRSTAMARVLLRSSWRRLTISSTLNTPVIWGEEAVAVDTASIGMALTSYRPNPQFRFGPALRLGVPLRPAEPWRPEVALGLEQAGSTMDFSASLGLRDTVATQPGQRSREQLYLLFLTSWDLSPNSLLYTQLDIHALIPQTKLRGGIAAGVEYGSTLFAGLAVRVSPWDLGGGVVSGQLAIGIHSK